MYLGLAPSPCVRGSHGVRLGRQSLLEGGSLSDRALRDRDCSGKKESLSESVDHTLVGDRDTPDY